MSIVERLRDERDQAIEERDSLRSLLEISEREFAAYRAEVGDQCAQIAEAIAERDHARREVVRLGRENDGLRTTIAVLAGRNEEFDAHPPVLVKPVPMTDLGLVGPLLEEM